MTPLRIAKILFAELTASQHQRRTPETDLIMSDAEAVAAFASGGVGEGMMSSLYQYASEQIAAALPSEGTVIDLGCGSGALLIGLAELFPKLRFLGVDLSDEMLKTAQARVAERGLRNVSFLKESFTSLKPIENQSIDFVFSSVALHHLRTTEELATVAREIDRVLTSHGGLYLIDFARLRTPRALKLFVEDAEPVAPRLLVRDYEASLKAAFSVGEWSDALQILKKRRLTMTAMSGAQFMQSATVPHPTHQSKLPASLKNKWTQLALIYMMDYLSLRLLMRRIS